MMIQKKSSKRESEEKKLIFSKPTKLKMNYARNSDEEVLKSARRMKKRESESENDAKENFEIEHNTQDKEFVDDSIKKVNSSGVIRHVGRYLKESSNDNEKYSLSIEEAKNSRKSNDLGDIIESKDSETQEKFESEIEEEIQNLPSKKELYDNLPRSVRKKFSALEIPRKEVIKNIEIVYNISRFLMKKTFKNFVMSPSEPTVSRPYGSKKLIRTAKTLIKKPDNIKKLFSKQKFKGKGGFGSVVVAKYSKNKSGDKIAIKKLPHISRRSRSHNYCEIGYLATCKHRNIVNYYDTFIVDQEIWIVMEYLEGGTLSEAAKAHTFTDEHVAFVAREMLKALKFLHAKNYVHRDLKSTNVMMSIKGEIKLIDFGLCGDFTEGPIVKMCGSPYWIPPEMILKQPHSFPADIWSLGVCILELFLRAPPYSVSSLKCMYNVATVGLVQCIPEEATTNANNFLTRCLQRDQSKRDTAEELLNHKWFKRKNLSSGIDQVLYKIFFAESLKTLGL